MQVCVFIAHSDGRVLYTIMISTLWNENITSFTYQPVIKFQ